MHTHTASNAMQQLTPQTPDSCV